MIATSPGTSLQIEALGPHHRLRSFSSGYRASDEYLRRQARNDMRARTAATFLLTRYERSVYGFYALTAHVTHLQNVMPEVARQLPRCPNLSTTLLQHLAIRRDCAPEWKEFLLLDALRRALSVAPQTGSVAVVVNLRDQRSGEEEKFYSSYGFQSLLLDRLFLPMTTIAEALAECSGSEHQGPEYRGE